MSRPTRNVIVSVVDLRRRLGERREVGFEVLLPELRVVDTRSVADRSIEGSVLVESIERGVSVLGEASFAWVGSCRRCLEDVEGIEVVDIDEIFQVDAPDDSELVDFDGERIDLLPVIRDAVLGGMPLAPLCRPDCAGPDPDRYPTMAADDADRGRDEEAEGGTGEPPADPRWAALADLELDPGEPDR